MSYIKTAKENHTSVFQDMKMSVLYTDIKIEVHVCGYTTLDSISKNENEF